MLSLSLVQNFMQKLGFDRNVAGKKKFKKVNQVKVSYQSKVTKHKVLWKTAAKELPPS